MSDTEARGSGLRLLACLALSLAAAVTILRASPESAVGLLHGRVIRAATGSPLEDVPLRANMRSIELDLDPAARTLTRTRHYQAPFMPVFGVSAEF